MDYIHLPIITTKVLVMVLFFSIPFFLWLWWKICCKRNAIFLLKTFFPMIYGWAGNWKLFAKRNIIIIPFPRAVVVFCFQYNFSWFAFPLLGFASMIFRFLYLCCWIFFIPPSQAQTNPSSDLIEKCLEFRIIWTHTVSRERFFS